MIGVVSQTNTVGTVNMLGLAKRTKARILIASTSEVKRDKKSENIAEVFHPVWYFSPPLGKVESRKW